MPAQRRFSSQLLATRIALLAILCLLASATSYASPGSPSQTCLGPPGVLCIYNTGGTATGGSMGLTMDGMNGSTASTVFQIGNLAAAGTLSFTTGALTSGTLGDKTVGNVVTFAPGTMTITTTGWNTFSGTLFSGSFSGIDWTYTGRSGQYYDYTLTGYISGVWGPSGNMITGQSTQLFFHSKSPYTGGPISLASGTTGVVVPEPASIGLMGTGLLAMAFLIRRMARQ